ncbi:Holliday junction branch migration protein RuvA [Slackia piriformis]|uniref:Holliday junction branch migration protein RuvA n=1 Tax=Slackia piriformis TaxID=626934 RepID=UPI0032C04CC7
MIAFLKGTMAGRTSSHAFISVNGVGFSVGMPATDLSRLPDRGSEVMVYTHLSVREDAMALYGFLSQEAHALFLRLIGVSGVGPKVALAALSTFKPEELVSAIQSQDVKAVSNIPGVGKKTAQRLILELKGTLAEEAEGNLFSAQVAEASARLQGARDALLSMGFSSAEADLALKDAPESADTEGALLQYALKRLGSI